ncbi:PREDICTED: L-type lectin-domain containing receptor kinase VIII.2-like [Nelumbo nucifera]|uniref:Protein kinase domain-containing protein n=2 Tax=Nelumbo nucifera TaxID=4432 RepID=A0A822YY12_NELNU|nr:PREDICTED: L-type lectin-domain containing receptor kinase VIII.2-like [Nelumbo nucifera]DAD36075.1 TPA_asm: hypothetical protein HUJ06_006715 [Nelumbo nucifera]
MEFDRSPFCSIICSTIISLIILNPVSFLVYSLDGPVTDIFKHLYFADFYPSTNPRIHHEVKLLGNAKFSDSKGSIQIPDPIRALDLRHQAGRAIFSSPIRLFDPPTQTPASFQTTFSIQFDTTPTPPAPISTSNYSDGSHGGSGLTFIIVPDEVTVGRPGPWLGMLNDACDDDYKAFAVEFDTRRNLEFGDPNDNHVGINLGSILSSTTINASDVGIYLRDGSVHRAWITYDGERKWIDIRLGPDGQAYPSTPIFSAPLDLSPFLKEYMFVGFSASTGNLTQIHNVLSWNFSSTSRAALRFPSTETCETKIFLQATKATEPAHRKPPSSFMIFVAVVVLCLVVLINLYYNGKRRKEKSTLVILPDKKQRPRPPNKPRRFSIAELSSATRCFSEAEVLGSDTGGIFYRGMLHNGCHVAVKRFSTRFLNSTGADRRRILKEIGVISRVRNPNLVPVRGWCCDKRETMVVYDYMSNGSLDRWLFGVGVLPWSRRFKVVKDVAEALSFLHSKKLAHKNVKTSSVFLDVSFRAVLGDFGFILGAPAVSSRDVAQKADVFGFGIVALEIVAGSKNSDEEGEELLDFAWRMHEREEKGKVVDRRMGLVYNPEQAFRVVEIGLLCTMNEGSGRPTMEEVVEMLNMERSIPQLPARRPVALFPYNSATDLCSGYSCAPFR